MTPKRDPSERVVIIGSGIGGLTAGILLAKLGFQATVVERNPLPGGLMRSYRISGIDCPTGVHYMGALDPGQPLRRLWDYLGVTPLIPLERMGLDGIIDRYIFDDFTFDLPTGIDAFEESLRQSFPAEQPAISMITDELRTISRTLSMLEVVVSPAMSFLSPESFESMGQRLGKARCSDRLAAVLSIPSTLIGIPLQECPVFYYYMTLASYLMSSWRLACSSTTMAEAFVARFESLGGQVIAGDGVSSLQADTGRVKGVVLESGRILEAETVVAAIHPKTVVSLLPPAAVRPSYAERVAKMINTQGLFGINLAVPADTHKALPYNLYRLYSEAGGALRQGIFLQLRQSGKPGSNLLSIITASSIEEWQPWENTTSGRRGKGYQEAKEGKANAFIEKAAQLLGPFREMSVLDIYTPLTLRDWVNSPDGSPYGILRSTGQLMKAASLNRTPVKGLFLAGQNRLSPGIMGTVLGSFQMVRQVIGHERFMRDIAGGFL